MDPVGISSAYNAALLQGDKTPIHKIRIILVPCSIYISRGG